MKKITLLNYLIITFFVTGCATMSNSSIDNVRVVTFDDNSKDTKCNLHNGKGHWSNVSPQQSLWVHRDGNDLIADCSNDTQTGTGSEDAVFKNDYLTQDILLDLCIISCFVDGSNKAWYDYGEYQR